MKGRTTRYFDIVPHGTSGNISPAEFRRALREAGMVPSDRGAFQWRHEQHNEQPLSAYLVSSHSLLPFYSNTKSLSVTCPKCGAKVPCNEWKTAVRTFKRTPCPVIVALSCCNTKIDIRKLNYDPPVDFSCSAISVHVPTEDMRAPAELIKKLEKVIGKKLDCFERIC